MAMAHAATGSQEVLERPPNEGATDRWKNTSIRNNINLTITGAARTLPLVLPEMTGSPSLCSLCASQLTQAH